MMNGDDWMRCGLDELRILYGDRLTDLEFEYNRAERAEALLKAMIEQKEYFRICWEEAEAELAEAENTIRLLEGGE